MHDGRARERYHYASPGCREYECSGGRRTHGLLWRQPGMVVCDHYAKSALGEDENPSWSDGTKLDYCEQIFVEIGIDFALGHAREGDDIAIGLCFVNPREERICVCVTDTSCASDGSPADA